MVTYILERLENGKQQKGMRSNSGINKSTFVKYGDLFTALGPCTFSSVKNKVYLYNNTDQNYNFLYIFFTSHWVCLL